MRVFVRMLVAVVFVCGSLGCSSASSGAAKSTTPKVDPDVISIGEIDSQPFRDAYDIVQLLRPSWFSRKSGSASTRRMGVSTSSSAIGAGLPVTEPSGNMIVDIGGGTTEIAVISLSGIVNSRSDKVAGNEMDEAITQYIKRKYNLLIGERTAEQVKIQIGSAYALDEPRTMEIKGRDLMEGIPKSIIISDEEIRTALDECINVIINSIRIVLERTPPELSADIADKGIVLAGGGALIKNLDKRIREETHLPVTLAENPLSCVVLGTGKMLSDFHLLRKMALT